LGFLISNSTYRFRPKGAPSREFHAAEICISCGLVSRVFLTQASILARKQSGEVHYVESGQIASLSCWLLAAAQPEWKMPQFGSKLLLYGKLRQSTSNSPCTRQ